jgi:drug/metabolite transporter (DMT)-like permease
VPGTRARPRGGSVVVVIAVLLVLLVALSPTLLFGETLSPVGLIAVGASLLGIGIVVRSRGGGGRALGTVLLIIGGVILAIAVGLTALLLVGWGRGY